MVIVKFITDHAIIISCIAILEAVLIIGLVVYILLKIKDDENDGIKATGADLSYFAGSNTSSLYYWKEAYEKLDEEYRSYRKKVNREEGHPKRGHESFPNSLRNNRATASSNEKEHTTPSTPSYNSYDEYAARERSKGIYVNQTINDDGTVKSEVIFDHAYEESLPGNNSPKYEFLEAANGGQFRKLLPSDEKCFFRTWEENGSRRFEFHGNVDKALANINAIFDDVCEIEGKRNGATNIENVEPGILDDKLNVEKPAKIKLV